MGLFWEVFLGGWSLKEEMGRGPLHTSNGPNTILEAEKL